MRGIAVIMIVVMAGCSSGEANAPTKRPPTLYLAAMSDDGLAVAADTDALLVNDGGRQMSVPLNDLVLMLEPGPSGVWAGTDGALYYIDRAGLQRFAIHGMPETILPAGGSTAYVIDDSGLVFVGEGLPGTTRRRGWSGKPDREESPSSDHGIHFYDR